MGKDLFGNEVAEPFSASHGSMNTAVARNRIACGWHPFGRKLREPRGETCGTCKHKTSHQPGANIYHKCELRGVTSGPATDLRLKWPACELWEGVVR